MATERHPPITDSTLIRVERSDEGDPFPCTWAKWKADNVDLFGEDEFAEIAAAIRDPDCKCIIRGYTKAMTYLRRQSS